MEIQSQIIKPFVFFGRCIIYYQNIGFFHKSFMQIIPLTAIRVPQPRLTITHSHFVNTQKKNSTRFCNSPFFLILFLKFSNILFSYSLLVGVVSCLSSKKKKKKKSCIPSQLKKKKSIK